MKKIVLFLCGLFVISTIAFANPPSAIEIQFNPATKTLTATIKHRVSDPKKHHIEKVDIGLNEKEIKALHFKKQESPLGQTISFMIPNAKKGDILSVEGYCNQSGKLEKKIGVQ